MITFTYVSPEKECPHRSSDRERLAEGNQRKDEIQATPWKKKPKKQRNPCSDTCGDEGKDNHLAVTTKGNLFPKTSLSRKGESRSQSGGGTDRELGRGGGERK